MSNTYAKPLMGFSNNARDSQRQYNKKQQERLIELEETARLARELYRKKPLVWLRERFGENPEDFKWSKRAGYENHSWDGDEDPLSNAWRDLANGNWVGVEAATGTSKTYWLSRVIFWFLDCWDDSLVVTSAPKQDQLKLNLWAEVNKAFYKFKKIRPDAEMLSLKLKVQGQQDADDLDVDEANYSNSWQAVGFVCGVGAEEQSATRAQGFHREDMLIILEEMPGMPMSVLTAFKNTCTGSHNLILGVGNPDNELDPLHSFCMLKNVKHYRISAFDYPNIVHGREIIKGAVTQESIDRRADEYGLDSPLYKSRVRGISPTQSVDSLIQVSWINDAHMRKLEHHNGFNALGIDVSNSENGDKAAMAWGKGSRLLAIQEFHCPNATHLAYNVLHDDWDLAQRGYKVYGVNKIKELGITEGFIGVDSVGVGVATVNGFLDKGYRVQALAGGEWKEAIPKHEVYDENGLLKEEYMYHFVSLRAQMYWELREDLRKGNISLWIQDSAIIDQLKRELCMIRFVLKAAYIQVEAKEEIKKRLGGKSPNVADAVVYWNWVRKGYRLGSGALPIMGGALSLG